MQEGNIKCTHAGQLFADLSTPSRATAEAPGEPATVVNLHPDKALSHGIDTYRTMLGSVCR